MCIKNTSAISASKYKNRKFKKGTRIGERDSPILINIITQPNSIRNWKPVKEE